MFNYLPEKIYNQIKDIDLYKAIDKELNDYKLRANTLKDMSLNDHNLEHQRGMVSLKNQLINLVIDTCPKLYPQYALVCNTYSLSELNEWFEEEIDIDIKLFILSRILDYSYSDGTYLEKFNTFITIYEDNLEIASTFSTYIHYTYFKAKFMNIASNGNISDKDYFNNVCIQLFKIAKGISPFVSSDILCQYTNAVFVEFLGYYSNIIYSFKTLKENIEGSSILDKLLSQEYQYKDYSYYNARLIDTYIDIYMNNYEFETAKEYLIRLINYIDNALLDYPKFNKGLGFYDKEMYTHMVILLRKTIKMQNLLKCEDFKNLKDEDRQYALSDIECGCLSNNHVNEVCKRYKESVDNIITLYQSIYKE